MIDQVTVRLRREGSDALSGPLAGINPQSAAAELARSGERYAFFRGEAGNWPNHVIACSPGKNPDEVDFTYLDPAFTDRRFARFGSAFGWPDAVSKTASALYRNCDVRLAAEERGVTVNTLREQLQVARESLGAENLPRLMMLANLASIGVDYQGKEADDFLANIFDLTQRQLRIARLAANGSTRAEISKTVGVSEALVKKELGFTFAASGVENILGLTRIISDSRALSIVTGYGDSRPEVAAPACSTVEVRSSDGRRIVGSDYGPRSGRPVLVLHSSMTSRSVHRALIEALQDHGFRPLAFDRPGFGDTDEVIGARPGEHDPFATAAQDMLAVCHALGFSKVSIVSRGAAQVVLAFLQLAAERVDRVVVVNPDPDTTASSKFEGSLGAIKMAFMRRPAAVQAMARFIATYATFDRVADTLVRSAKDSPPDLGVLANRDNIVEYFRGMEFLGRRKLAGYINEQVALATKQQPSPLPGTRNVVLLQGGTDFLHDPDEALSYWANLLPNAKVVKLDDAGRFLAYSHAKMVAEELRKG